MGVGLFFSDWGIGEKGGEGRAIFKRRFSVFRGRRRRRNRESGREGRDGGGGGGGERNLIARRKRKKKRRKETRTNRAPFQRNIYLIGFTSALVLVLYLEIRQNTARKKSVP